MPLYEYRCPRGHARDELRRYADRDLPLTCACGDPLTRIFSAHHRQPDGLYSHDPNLGDPAKFERNLAGIQKLKDEKAQRLDARHPRSGYGGPTP